MKECGIVIPFYYLSDDFETDTHALQNTINSVKKFSCNIVVIDDGTSLSEVNDAHLIKHKSNLGKGSSIRTGLEYLLSNRDIQFIVEIDADNDQDPGETYKFTEVLKERKTDHNFLIIGDRYTAPEMQKPNNYRSSINQLQSMLFSYLGFKVRDSVSGFRGYSRNFAEIIMKESKSEGFGIATEEIILAYLNSATLVEIPLEYAKPRKKFTKAYKLGEVLDGILIHERKLKSHGHQKLMECLFGIREQIQNQIDPIVFRIGNEEFSFRYRNETYGKD